MRLTKEMKEAVLVGLVGHATKKRAPKAVKLVNQLRKQWQDMAREYAAKYLPEVDQKRWPQLIQDGLCYSMSTPDVTVNKSTDPEKPNYSKDALGYASLSYTAKGKAEERAHELVKSAMNAAGWSGVFNIISMTCYETYCRVQWSVRDAGVPRANFMNVVHARDLGSADNLVRDWTINGLALAALTTAMSQDVLQVIKEARAYYAELELILDSVSTDVALENLFPEAVQFLPNRPKKVNAPAPVDLVNKARKKLLEGIPE